MYNSDMQFSTYLDVIFYLFAGLAILHRRFIWIPAIALLASLNRETSGLIPFLVLASIVGKDIWYKGLSGLKEKTEPLVIFGLSLAIYILVFVFLRFSYGPQPLLLPNGHHPGLDVLQYNLGSILTWDLMLATLGVIPFVALFGYRKWPLELRRFFWVIVPLWFAIHMVAAVMVETRLFLVPQAMIFIPGLLLFAQRETSGQPSLP